MNNLKDLDQTINVLEREYPPIKGGNAMSYISGQISAYKELRPMIAALTEEVKDAYHIGRQEGADEVTNDGRDRI